MLPSSPPIRSPLFLLFARRSVGLPAVLALALTSPPAHASAQAPAANGTASVAATKRGVVAGQVVDAASGAPLVGASVVLTVRPDGVLTPGGATVSAHPSTARATRTDTAGRYRFGGLPAGEYRLHASRLGYMAAAVDVTLADAAPEVSLGLTVAPLALRPVAVRAPRTASESPRGPSSTDATAGDARVLAAQQRQRRYLAPDVRELTAADVSESVTLAETDLFRALHRLPGVSTRDEWAAELWTRGARADQTRIYFDGMPLFSPLHAFGALSAVNPDAVGAAYLHAGVRPASLAEGGAAVLDLRSRAGGCDSGGVGGAGELGIASVRLSLDGRALGDRLAWRVAGRRSYADYIVRAVNPDDFDDGFPHFRDLFGRVDYQLGRAHTLTVSGVEQRNATLRSGLGLRGRDLGARWGDRALRATLAGPFGAWRVAHTVGVSDHRFDGRPATFRGFYDSAGVMYDSTFTNPNTEVRVRHATVRGHVEPAASPEAAWSAGYELTRQSADYIGPGRSYYAGDEFARGGDTTLAGGVTVGALWASRRWRPTARLTVEPGLRLEVAPGLASGVVRSAPRIAARFTADDRTHVSAAVGRSVQYTQALPRVGVSDEVRFYPGALWLAAGRDVPPLTTDLATVGVERWLGGGWLGSLNAYARRALGVVTTDPTPGTTSTRRLFVTGTERARGLELSARRLVGRTTATVAYSYGVSTLAAAGYRYASPQDRTHTADLTVSHRLTNRWRLGAAFSAATGAPYTSTVFRVAYPDSASDVPAVLSYEAGAPGAGRRPPLFGADLAAEWTRPFARWELGAFARLHSPLAMQSTGSYRGDGSCVTGLGEGERCSPSFSRREDTVPVIPSLGLRFRF